MEVIHLANSATFHNEDSYDKTTMRTEPNKITTKMKQNDKRFGKYLADKTAIKSALLAPTNHNLNIAIESSIETPSHSFAKPTPFFAKHNTNHGTPPRKPAFLHDLFASLPFRWKTRENRTYNGSSHQIVRFQTVISFESCPKWFEFFLTYCTIQTRRD